LFLVDLFAEESSSFKVVLNAFLFKFINDENRVNLYNPFGHSFLMKVEQGRAF